jgi:hypothetical protein
VEFLADSLYFSDEAIAWILLLGGVVGLTVSVVAITIFYLPLRLFFRKLLSREPKSQAVNKTSAADQSNKEPKSWLINILRQGSWMLFVAFGVIISLPFLIFYGLKLLVALIMR